MPDNSADYEDPDDLRDDKEEDDADTRQDLLWNLLLLINPGDAETAQRQFSMFCEIAADVMEAEGQAWLETLRDVIDWTSGFYVDDHDRQALMEAIDELAARWNLRIDWGGDIDDEDFLNAHDAPALLAVAYDRLREYGYSIWCWDTGIDARAGWMVRSGDDQDMQRLAGMLNIDLRPGNDPF